MRLKIGVVLLFLFGSSQSFGAQISNLKDSCALTLTALNVIKISKRAALDLKPLQMGTKLDIFSNLARSTPVKPLLLLNIAGHEDAVFVRDIRSHEIINGEWEPIHFNNLPDFIVRFTNGTQTYLSQIKSVQLMDRASVQVAINNHLKTARFTFTPDDKTEDMVMRVAEGNSAAMSFLVDVIAYQTHTMTEEKDTPLREEVQESQIKNFLLIIAGYNIGGEQIVRARNLFSGSDEERAREFYEAVLVEPTNLAAKINEQAPTGYQHRAFIP